MKRGRMALLAAGVAVLLTACGNRISEPVAEEELWLDLPEEYTVVTVDGTELDLPDLTLEVKERNIDIRHQTDDVTCQVTLSGEEGSLFYTCQLHYAYVRETGWEIRSYELDGEPVLTLDSEDIRQEILDRWEAELKESYQEVELIQESWTELGDQYTLCYTLGNTETYLEEAGTATATGALNRQGSFDYRWRNEEMELEAEARPQLTDTVWHIADAEARIEVAFQITGEEDGVLSLSGVVRSENWAGYIKEKTLEGTAEWSVSDYGCITFSLPQINSTTLSCSIQSDRQWVNLDGVYLGELEVASMPDSGSLSDLMELEIESWIPTLEPETTEPEETQPAESEATEEDPEESETPTQQPGTTEEGYSWWDYIFQIFGF